MRSHIAHLGERGFGRLSTRPHRGRSCTPRTALAVLTLLALLAPGRSLARPEPETTAELAEALALMETGACDQALILFQALIDADPRAPRAAVALFDSGLCHERGEDLASALAAYSRVVQGHRRSPAFHDALFRRGLVHAALDEPRSAQRDFRRLRRLRAARSAREQAVLELQLGACHAALDRPARATQRVLPALETLESVDLREDPDAAWYLAQAHVVLGDVLADGMRDVSLDTSDGELQRRRLSRRLELFGEARGHYEATQLYDAPLWTCAAGYKLGRLHEENREDLLAAPVPGLLTEDQARLYRIELERRTAAFLTAAATLYRGTLEFAAMAHVENRWVDGARQRLDELELDPASEGRGF